MALDIISKAFTYHYHHRPSFIRCARQKCIFQRSIDRSLLLLMKERKEQYDVNDGEKFLIDDNSATKCLIAMHKLIASDHSIAQSDTEQHKEGGRGRGWAAPQTPPIDRSQWSRKLLLDLTKIIQKHSTFFIGGVYRFSSIRRAFHFLLWWPMSRYNFQPPTDDARLERFLQPLNLIEWAQVERGRERGRRWRIKEFRK